MSALILALLVTASGCSSDDTPTGSDRTQNPESSTGPNSPGSSSTDLPALELSKVDADLDSPIAAIALPRGRGLLVGERAGVLRVLDLSANTPKLSDPVLDISDDVSTEMERGLLGLAFNKASDKLILSYTNSTGDSRLDSYEVTWGSSSEGSSTPELSIDSSTRRELLEVQQPYPNHNGGHAELGPDGMLYFGLGDGGSSGDPEGNAQNRSSLLGKLLRIDPDATSSADLAPAGNPFLNTKGAKPEIWSTGLRNPWRFSFDSKSGDLWVADVGQDRFEEINRVTQADGGAKGANFGWDLFEGDEPFDDPDPAPSPASDGPFVEPVFVYDHGPGCSVTGGVVYRGKAIASLAGMYLYSDFCDGTIRALDMTKANGATSVSLGVKADQVAGFTTDIDGEVYVISLSDGLFRLVPA